MKAIINVPKGSAYARYNGKEFFITLFKAFAIKGKLLIPVKGVDPEHPDNFVDFNQDELIFVNK